MWPGRDFDRKCLILSDQGCMISLMSFLNWWVKIPNSLFSSHSESQLRIRTMRNVSPSVSLMSSCMHEYFRSAGKTFWPVGPRSQWNKKCCLGISVGVKEFFRDRDVSVARNLTWRIYPKRRGNVKKHWWMECTSFVHENWSNFNWCIACELSIKYVKTLCCDNTIYLNWILLNSLF